MLPLPELDDRTFEQLVEEARRMIPVFAPRWTDENYHDPGITFIELFAWLSEMQQYFLNRVTDKNKLKFINLLGIKPRAIAPARTLVTLEGAGRELRLPGGIKLLAGDRVFETLEPITVLPARLEKVITYTGGDAADYTSANEIAGLSYPAFGRNPLRGSRLYLGFSHELPVNAAISLAVRLFEDYPVQAGKIPEQGAVRIPSGLVDWKYYGSPASAGEAPEWYPLELLRDETVHLSCSGRLTFKLPTRMTPVKIHPALDRGRYWICCSLAKCGFELPPRVEKIMLNTVPAVQHDTLSQVITFSGSGEPSQTFIAEDYLSCFGINEVQVRDLTGSWQDWQLTESLSASGPADAHCSIVKNTSDGKTMLLFGDGEHGRVAPPGEANIRLVSYVRTFAAERYLGTSNGLPDQVFRFSKVPSVIPGDLLLQVGVKDTVSGDYLWQDWRMVGDFDASRPDDRHYVFDSGAGKIIFGNNEKGSIPEPGRDSLNLRIIRCRLGGGERGNVKGNEINEISGGHVEYGTLTVTNNFPAEGGRERESLDDAIKSLLRDLKTRSRAVTNEDYEQLARSTPGLRVARVKAIPLYHRGLQNYPANKAPARVTVVVVPYSEDKKPVPGKGFLETVRRHLDQYRLITTEVDVIPPDYIKITVHAVIVAASRTAVNAMQIKESLNRLLHPLGDRTGSGGWPFGRTVYKGDIYSVINEVQGVDYVKEMWLTAEGPGARHDKSGGIEIPPHGLVYPGEHDLEIISRADL